MTDIENLLTPPWSRVALVNDSDDLFAPATMTALSAKQAEAVATADAQRLSSRATADTARSGADHRVAFEDATTLLEMWADKTAWSSTYMVVDSGALVSAPSDDASNARRAFLPGTGTPFRIRGTIQNIAGGSGTAKAVSVGVTKDTHDASYTPGNRLAVGFYESGQAFIYIGTGLGGSGANAMGSGAAQAGTWTYAIWSDGLHASVSMVSPDGLTTYRYTVAMSQFPSGVRALVVTGNDSRGVAGHRIGPIGARNDTVSITPRTSFEGAVRLEARTRDAASEAYRIVEPASFDSRRVYPLVISCHGNTQNEMHLTLSAQRETFMRALGASGFFYAAHNMHGSLWGAQQSLADLGITYLGMKARYPIGPVIVLGESMGALAALNAVTRQQIPIAGVGLLDGVMNLAWNWGNGASGDGTPDSTPIKAAYGIASNGSDYAEKTAGYDPMLQQAIAFRGVPMQIMASPSDTRIPKAQHADLMVAKLAGYTRDLTAKTHAGAHTQDTAWQVADWMPFFQRAAGLSS